jgi:hypothetical protein
VDEQVFRATVWWLKPGSSGERQTRQTGHASTPPHTISIETVRYSRFLFVGVQVHVERAVPLHVFFGYEGVATQSCRVRVGAGQRYCLMVLVSIDAKVFWWNSMQKRTFASLPSSTPIASDISSRRPWRESRRSPIYFFFLSHSARVLVCALSSEVKRLSSASSSFVWTQFCLARSSSAFNESLSRFAGKSGSFFAGVGAGMGIMSSNVRSLPACLILSRMLRPG